MDEKKLTIVVFGGTGDLTKRKLVPAFASLIKQNKISKDSILIGIARGDLDNESYKNILVESAKDSDKDLINMLNIGFFRGDAENPETLRGLVDMILNSEHKGGNDRIFYLATSYKLFPKIAKELKNQGLHQNKQSIKIIFEKPFGHNLTSSEEIDNEIKNVFSEEQVFRIDHYLAKETVQNINVLKFANPIFESLLCADLVDSIELIIDEELSVGNRIGYYNDVGAIKDMIQNHMLQVLSLLLMDRPSKLTTERIHDEKVKALKRIEIMPAEEHLLGQYYSYESEAKKSGFSCIKTETFAKILLNCKHERWNGTKLILRTGKNLERKYGQIKIKFKHNKDKKMKGMESNEITIGIYPNQDVKMKINTRKPGSNWDAQAISLDFMHDSFFGPNTINEYAVLLSEAIIGEKMLFTRFDELQECWRIIEDIDKIKKDIKFVIYPDGKDPEDLIMK